MIERVAATKFKGGITFDQPLNSLTWFCGPNGSGKSARAQAIQIALTGAVMGHNKTNSAVLDVFGDGDQLAVEITANGKRIGRQLSRSTDGKITQKPLVGGKRVSKEAFGSALATAGNPKVFDIQAFWSLSDNKKIDEMFGAAGSAELAGITEEIADAKSRLNKVRGDIRAKETERGNVEVSLSQLELPNIEIPELQAKMKEAEAEIETVRKRISDAEKAAAEKEAAEKERIAAERRAKEDSERRDREKAEADRKAKEEAEKKAAADAKAKQEEESRRQKEQAEREKKIAEEAAAKAREEMAKEKYASGGIVEKPSSPEDVVPVKLSDAEGGSLSTAPKGGTGEVTPGAAAGKTLRYHLGFVDKMLTTLDAAGCQYCAARVVANAELKRLTASTAVNPLDGRG